MELTCHSSRRVFLVDPEPGDYSDLLNHLASSGMQWQFLNSIEEALRLPKAPGAIWLVKFSLYREGGARLREHLNSIDNRFILLCVGEHRDPPADREKVQLVVPYVGKPLLPLWLDNLLPVAGPDGGQGPGATTGA